jgi:hypothetical protein
MMHKLLPTEEYCDGFKKQSDWDGTIIGINLQCCDKQFYVEDWFDVPKYCPYCGKKLKWMDK